MIEAVNRKLLLVLLASPDASRDVFLFAKALADGAFYVGACLLVFVWVLGNSSDRRSAVAATLSALTALSLAAVISSFYFHPRPFMNGLSPNYLQHASDSSFPSDHATVLFAIAASFRVSSPPSMRSIWIAALAIAVAVSWSRVFLGVHYPLDILGGALLGLACAAIAGSRHGRQLAAKVTSLGERVYEWPLAQLTGIKFDK